MILLLSVALAAPVGHYDPNAVAAASTAFGRASEAAAPRFQEAQDRADALAAALRQYEAALDLLGDRAPMDQRDHLRELEKSFFRSKAVMSRFVGGQVGGFDDAFQDAVQRAIGKREVAVCAAEPEGLRMGPSFGAREKKACPGANLNAEIAAAIDADPKLAADLDRLLAATWPTLDLPREAQAPIGGGAARVVDAWGFFSVATPDALSRIDEADEDARLPLQAMIEAGASKEEAAAHLDEARAIDAQTAMSRHDMADPLLGVVEKVWAKAAKQGTTWGWCAQPALLGGCTLRADPADLAALLADRKVAKAASLANGWTP